MPDSAGSGEQQDRPHDTADPAGGDSLPAEDATGAIWLPEARRSAKFYESLVKNSTDLIVVFGRDASVTYVGPSAWAVLGYDPQVLGPQLRADLFHPDDIPAIVGAIETGMRTPGLTGPTVGRLLHADGTWRSMEAFFTNLLDDPTVEAVVCNMRDITERRDVEARFQLLAENGSDLVCLFDLQGNCLFVSPAATEMFGIEPSELARRRVGDFGVIQDLAAAKAALSQAAAGTRGVAFTSAIVRPDGTERWVEFVSSPVHDPSTGAITGVQTAGRDVTDRRAATAALRESEARFRRLFDAAPVGKVLVDDDGVVLESNSTIRSMFGLGPDDLPGHVLWDQFHPEDAQRIKDLPRLERQNARHQTDVRYTTPDGWRWGLAAISVHHVGGAERQLLVHVQDNDAAKKAEQMLRHAANHDALTGLANRLALTAALEDLLATTAPATPSTAAEPPQSSDTASGREQVSLFFLDLLGFKRVNDALGHAAGDELLVAVARRLTQLLDEETPGVDGAVAGRLGGNEFVLLARTASPHAAAGLAEHLVEVVTAPMTVAGRELTVRCAVGVAAATAQTRNLTELLRVADAAHFEAKRRPGGGFVLATGETTSAADVRLRVESDLRDGLARGDFTVVYQPVFALDGGAIVAAEALVRWEHPTRGLLLPDAFIDVAEDSGLIEPLGAFVLEQACRDAMTWVGVAELDCQAAVAVNVSARQLGNFVTTVTDTLARTGLPASRLVLEVTESSLLTAVPEAWTDLHRLHAAGVTVAVDDFGTGYAPLTHLKDVPARVVKIDRRFVAGSDEDPVDAAIVAAVVNMAHAAGCQVVAEGLSTRTQYERLTGLGCELAQGFTLSPPISSQEFARRLRDEVRISWPFVPAPAGRR